MGQVYDGQPGLRSDVRLLNCDDQSTPVSSLLN